MRAGVDGGSAAMVEIIERDGQAVDAIADSLISLQPRTDANRSMREAELHKHLFPHEVLIRLAGNARDRVIENSETKVRVFVLFARDRHQIAVAKDGFVHGRWAVGLVGIEKLIVQRQTR